jgi:hypothetical protein
LPVLLVLAWIAGFCWKQGSGRSSFPFKSVDHQLSQSATWWYRRSINRANMNTQAVSLFSFNPAPWRSLLHDVSMIFDYVRLFRIAFQPGNSSFWDAGSSELKIRLGTLVSLSDFGLWATHRGLFLANCRH